MAVRGSDGGAGVIKSRCAVACVRAELNGEIITVLLYETRRERTKISASRLRWRAVLGSAASCTWLSSLSTFLSLCSLVYTPSSFCLSPCSFFGASSFYHSFFYLVTYSSLSTSFSLSCFFFSSTLRSICSSSRYSTCICSSSLYRVPEASSHVSSFISDSVT